MKPIWPLVLALVLLASCVKGPQIAPGGIISNNPCIDGILSDVAAPGQIAAISRYSHDPQSASAPLLWSKQLPAIGNSAEEIIAAKPKMLLTGNFASGGTNAAIAKAGISLFAVGVPANIGASQEQVRAIAKLLGREAAGADLIARMQAATRSEPETDGSEISAIIWQTGGFVAGKDTIQDEMLARAGFINASHKYGLNQWDNLSIETLLLNPPSVIFMPKSAIGEDGRSLAMRRILLRHMGDKVRIEEFPDRLLFCGGPTVIEAMAVMRRAYAHRKADRT